MRTSPAIWPVKPPVEVSWSGRTRPRAGAAFAMAVLTASLLPTLSLAMPEEKAAALFEALRADLPCVASAEPIAARFDFARTDYNEKEDNYQTIEFKKNRNETYVIVSYEKRDGEHQNALSLSIYETGSDYPANLTSAFAAIWDLPMPTPNRDDPSVAQFSWQVKFPNGPMEVVIWNTPAAGLTQIYARTLKLEKDQANACLQ